MDLKTIIQKQRDSFEAKIQATAAKWIADPKTKWSEDVADNYIKNSMKHRDTYNNINTVRGKEIYKNVTEMENADLLGLVMSLSGGDDYDGCFTEKGQHTFNLAYLELTVRLMNCGFLDKPLDNLV